MLTSGDKIPHFSLKTDDGSDFNSKTILEKGPMVLFFYPKDYTPGCTAEACNFRDTYPEFRALGATVAGISTDSAGMHRKFSKTFKLPYALLTDVNGELARKFGVKKKLFNLLPGRATFVVNTEGIIVHSYASLNASQHHKEALQALEKITAP